MELPTPMDRLIHLSGEVSQESINAIVKSIVSICKSDKSNTGIYYAYGFAYNAKPIELYINSYGGDLYAALGAISVIESASTPVHTIVTGSAMSAGFLISISGKRRFAMGNSTFMYHQLSSYAWGKMKDIEEHTIEAKRLQDLMESIVMSRTNLTRKFLKESYTKKEDMYFDAISAFKSGIVDEVI
jgi:ATP-dependent Clp protease protease subunit